jgi:hypothetical protein
VAVLAGETIIAGKVPGERIATDIVTSNSGGIGSTETVIQTVTAALVSGRTYRVTSDFGYQVSTVGAGDDWSIKIREDNLTGTQIQARRAHANNTASSMPFHIEVEYTAVSTGNKTFVVTADLSGGAGLINLIALADQPAYFYVDYIRG